MLSSHITFWLFQDEENINLKEQHRVDVRKELSQLEMKCTDMASLLRGLGIQVGSGLHPSSQEVYFIILSLASTNIISEYFILSIKY